MALFVLVTLFARIASGLGEPMLELLGLSPAAISVTGGIALFYAGIPTMRGLTGPAAGNPSSAASREREDFRRVLFMPVFFPLTAGGTTFATLICFRAQVANVRESMALSAAAVA